MFISHFDTDTTMSGDCIRDIPWAIKCKVISQAGTCAIGHSVGDEFLITEDGIKGKICISALYSLLPKAFAMMFNARFPWLKDQCRATHACPDAKNPVVFELTRIESDHEV